MMRRLVRMRHQIAFVLFGALVALLALYPIGVVDAATDVAATRVEVENFLVEPTATTPPETSITSGPSGGVSGTRANFEFASLEANSTFRCRLLPLESAPTNCTSPKTYRGLTATTEYTFRVWATDASGNTDASPATRTFTPNRTLAARLEPPTWRPRAKGQATRRRVINVKDFGATGNGTSDDTAAFERAMAQAARLGGAVYVPAPGNYRIFNVTPPSNTRLLVQAGATLKKYGGKNGALFEVRGPNDTTFVKDVHIWGVGGTFTIDLHDAGPRTTGIQYRNVRNFTLRNMVCIQNNDNPTGEPPSSHHPCVGFLPTPAGAVKGVHNHPFNGELKNVHSRGSPFSWGLTQISGGENLRFFDISSEGGVPLRLESYRNNWTPIDNLLADGVRCKNGHDAVHMNPHGAHHGKITIRNVVADSCESALSLKTDELLGGSFGADSSITGVRVIPGKQAQLRTKATSDPLDAWVIGPSRWCIDNNDPLGYKIGLSKVDCGGLPIRRGPVD
jgi:Pectate lyase superfamily protein